jgi:hypothetical protein
MLPAILAFRHVWRKLTSPYLPIVARICISRMFFPVRRFGIGLLAIPLFHISVVPYSVHRRLTLTDS